MSRKKLTVVQPCNKTNEKFNLNIKRDAAALLHHSDDQLNAMVMTYAYLASVVKEACNMRKNRQKISLIKGV